MATANLTQRPAGPSRDNSFGLLTPGRTSPPLCTHSSNYSDLLGLGAESEQETAIVPIALGSSKVFARAYSQQDSRAETTRSVNQVDLSEQDNQKTTIRVPFPNEALVDIDSSSRSSGETLSFMRMTPFPRQLNVRMISKLISKVYKAAENLDLPDKDRKLLLRILREFIQRNTSDLQLQMASDSSGPSEKESNLQASCRTTSDADTMTSTSPVPPVVRPQMRQITELSLIELHKLLFLQSRSRVQAVIYRLKRLRAMRQQEILNRIEHRMHLARSKAPHVKVMKNG
ncbi:unnamed protein product [Protopolystoma xenopodis]|uniref:Uncharacterized protein n=1 Tax=Protopolystoma xenopodis TaxID=117903 RepID=A0A3S4ZV19_9PLAT|nr:unnamed protein product [Protopolystoma xenopodis]